MIFGKSVLAIIPARGGSKGLPRKNIRIAAGKPLIAWSILEAQKSKYIDRLILSSEDEEIISIARQWKCDVPFIRPAELATDHISGIEPVLHAIGSLEEKYDYVVLLQPTSPLRIAEDIDGCIQRCVLKDSPVCVTVTEPDKSPYWMFSIEDNSERMVPFIKQKNIVLLRQNLKKLYALNGSVYVARIDWLLKIKKFITDETIAYVMPKERSIDIDTELDFTFCEFLLAKDKPKGCAED